MKTVLSMEAAKLGQSLLSQDFEGTAAEPLEINVIFTRKEETAAALRAAESLARELGACIRLRAGIVVPLQLPLEQPLVSVPFVERMLSDLVEQSRADGVEHTVHLYICRDWIDALFQSLKPNSIAVIGGRKRWLRTPESRLEHALRAHGNRVVMVDERQHQPE